FSRGAGIAPHLHVCPTRRSSDLTRFPHSLDMYQTRRRGAMKKLKFFMDNRFVESETGEYMDVYNPSTGEVIARAPCCTEREIERDRKSTRLNSSHVKISYAVFCL